LSLAIATTRANGASGNIIRIVFTKALADSLVCAGKHSKELLDFYYLVVAGGKTKLLQI
jgi:hypothetical protein